MGRDNNRHSSQELKGSRGRSRGRSRSTRRRGSKTRHPNPWQYKLLDCLASCRTCLLTCYCSSFTFYEVAERIGKKGFGIAFIALTTLFLILSSVVCVALYYWNYFTHHQTHYEDLSFQKNISDWWIVMWVFVGVSVFGFLVLTIMHFKLRRDVEKEHNIEKQNAVKDCCIVMFCEKCSLCQLRNEMFELRTT
ncbi:uncharacterized protein LOC142337429 [Convolutriloba macropyga]|uniref:uncharacterized protein LOC142337429 n=1 Tax=Convolutriloba macropyga TaxID=536237 RepID=UPI003F5246A7